MSKDFKADPERSMAIANKMCDLLESEPAAVQGAAIADVMAGFIAGHHPTVRKIIADQMIETMWKIVGIYPSWDEMAATEADEEETRQ